MCEPVHISINVHRAVNFKTFFVMAGPVDRCIAVPCHMNSSLVLCLIVLTVF